MQRISLRQTGTQSIQVVIDRTEAQTTLRVSSDMEHGATSRTMKPNELEPVDAAVAAVQVPVQPGGSADPSGAAVSLTFHTEGLESHFHWAGPVPPGWEPLGRVMDELLKLAQPGSAA